MAALETLFRELRSRGAGFDRRRGEHVPCGKADGAGAVISACGWRRQFHRVYMGVP